jgi:hypothetical protein
MAKIKLIKLLIPGLIVLSLIGCGNDQDQKPKTISEDKSTNQIIDSTRFKLLNIKYFVPGTSNKYIWIVCDTDTKLLYLDSNTQCPFNKVEINKNGEVVTKQYTLDEFKTDYKNKHGKDITFRDENEK